MRPLPLCGLNLSPAHALPATATPATDRYGDRTLSSPAQRHVDGQLYTAKLAGMLPTDGHTAITA